MSVTTSAPETFVHNTLKNDGLTIERLYTTEGVHPYDEVNWEHRDVVQTNWKTGETVFEQRGVEFPDFWSVNASTIVTTKYFRGAVGTEVRERSLKQLIDRVVLTYTKAGVIHSNGQSVTFQRDAAGRIVAITDPDLVGGAELLLGDREGRSDAQTLVVEQKPVCDHQIARRLHDQVHFP